MVKPMAVNKKHDEFHTLDMNVGWETPLGRKFSSCRATSPSATTAREAAENHFRRTPTPCVRPTLTTDRSSQTCILLEMHYFDPV
jgi:hypothetical protein